MHLRSLPSLVLSACCGALIGYGIWTLYWNADIIPLSGYTTLFYAIGKVMPGILLDHPIPLAIVVKSFPLNILAGLVVGYFLPRFEFQRTFVYSALLWPLGYFALSFFFIASLPSYAGTGFFKQSLADQSVVAFAVFSWYFLGLYMGFAIRRFRKASLLNVDK